MQPPGSGGVAMNLPQTAFEALASLFGLSVLAVVPVLAQGGMTAPASPPASPEGSAQGIVVGLVILAMLVAIGIGVKLRDLKQKHEDEAAALQGRISDSLAQV